MNTETKNNDTDTQNHNPETSTLQPVRPSHDYVFEAFTQQLLQLVDVIDRLGFIAPEPGDIARARRASRDVTPEAIRLMAARALRTGGVVGGVAFNADAIHAHLAFADAAGPFLGLLEQVKDRIEGRILLDRAQISGLVKAAQGALAAHERLQVSPAEKMLLGELRAVRPRRSRPKAKAQKKEAPKPA